MNQRWSEEEIAAEEERIGMRLPEPLRSVYLEGAGEQIVLTDPDGTQAAFNLWGPSTTGSDTRGRTYPTSGMAAETQEVRDVGEDFLTDEVVVAFGQEAAGDLAVVVRDGSLGWWRYRGGSIVPAEVDWDPDEDLLAEL